MKHWWNRKPVWERFVWTVGIGVGVALVVFLYVLTRPLFCEPQNNEWTAQSYQNSAPAHEGTNRGGNIVVKKKTYPEGHNANAYEKYKYDLREIACSEIKFTDVLVALLTYCLVVVGWFTMRSADENAKMSQRAYLVGGPFFGIPKKNVEKWMMENRASKQMFHGPWRMIVTNFGRTAAFSTKIEWGLCPKDEFPKGTPIRTILESASFEQWRMQYMREPDIFQNIFGEANKHYQLRRIEIDDRDKYLGWIHFGRVTYKDVFKDTHHAAFAYLMGEEGSDAFGTYLSDEHD